ncbi:11357_t:CDS:2 [Paraglomus brasilianum]|uniref:11357_t:CDS:1 n=1 Tax=Paraglomus brasilianum TaxID=144538 RepID=A0A9N9DC52_9GLOM|nr:11357_t:CDS:2 [Paraglomus brasilianum]
MSTFFDAPMESWTYGTDNMKQEFYPGHSALVAYLQKHEIWSYSEFLTLHQDIIVNALPFSTEWNGLNGIWTKRFLKAAEELDSNAFEDLKNKVVSERSINSLKAYWEEVIRQKMQLAKATPTSKRVLNEQEDLDASAEDEREEGEDDGISYPHQELYSGHSFLVQYLKERASWSYTEFLTLYRDRLIDVAPFGEDWTALDRQFMRAVLAVIPDPSGGVGAPGPLSSGSRSIHCHLVPHHAR